MGVELLTGLAVMALMTVASYLLYKPNMNSPKVKASGLDDFTITKATEGTPFPVVFGRVKISGNIIWYGNLITKKQKEETGGGLFGGGSSVTTGYQYYLDCWQTLCIGPARVLGVYKENKQFITSEIAPTWSGVMEGTEQGAQTTTMTVNRGNEESNFTVPVEFFTPLPNVCSIFMSKVFCDNGTSFPSLHFVVESNHNYIYGNPSNGVNPANAVWYVLTTAGVRAQDIDASFGSAASYWNSKGYGINIAIGAQAKVREVIEQILTPLGGFYFESGGKHYLNPGDPYQASYGHIEDEFIKFAISRRSWDDTLNDIKATFTEEAKDFTERTAVVQNAASVNLLGKVYTKTYDLTLFRTLESTQKRMAELIKAESYPYAEVEFSTSLKYADLIEGSIVDLTNTKLGVKKASFRVVRKSFENIDSNEVTFNGVQVVESLFDDKWVSIGTGSSSWKREAKAPVPLTKTKIWELPRTPTSDAATVLVLAARESELETQFNLYSTPTGTDYSKVESFNSFSKYATLSTAYSANTYDIDDSETGLVITPAKSGYDIPTVSRSGLFSTNRYLLIDNELLKFQTATFLSDGKIRITGIIRGVLNTAKAAHSANAPVWIIDDPDCAYTPNNGMINGYYKISPTNIVGSVPLSSVSSTSVGAATFGQKPFPISRVNGVRLGSTIKFMVYVRDMTPAGAGVSASSTFVTTSDTDVVIEWKLSSSSTWNVLPATVGDFTVDSAASVTVNVRAKEFGIYTPTVSLTVGTTDGSYTV